MNRPTAIFLGSGVALSAFSLWTLTLAIDAVNEPVIWASFAGMGIGAVMVKSVTSYLVRFPNHDRRDDDTDTSRESP